MKRTCLFGAALAATLTVSIPASIANEARTNLLFVLDSSGSMWGKVDNEHKITTAKTVLNGLMGDLPTGTSAGLMVYGHRKQSWCEDVELIAPIGSISAANAGSTLDRITPKGKTPIAYSLKQTRAAFQGLDPDETKHVVLISDGIETCEGDPCAVAGDLASAGINVKVHVVGFDISETDRKQLQCIADNGNGKYFSADSTVGFAEAIADVVTEVAQADPTPQPEPQPQPQPQPEAETPDLFFDDFNGTELAAHWEIQNPDADAYLVEDGHLLAVASGGASLDNGDIVNMFKLNRDLPKGDWVATMQFRMPYHTGREAAFFGLYQDKDNHTIGMANAQSYYEDIRGARMFLSAQKVAKGKKTSFNKVIWGGAGGQAYTLSDLPNPFVLRITKKGRSYTPAVRIQDGDVGTWIEQESVTLLRPKGKLAFGIYQWQAVKGETPVYVDWIRIKRPE